ncbi:type II secretion system protein N [Acinetobacter rudis]|uniref:Type II secretion system protein C n=1 Tax=Acinetobacter rudis CIP 110305 TaxID=421052 RepID=S3N6L9_9GAMM|nr:type II secretion system protein N [Acinetobacter rudis]EPF69904.1 type II secretion system protein C [Acinetobacter rudis CIP 110305]
MNIREQFEKIQWQKIDRAAPFVLLLFILVLCWKLAAILWWVVAPPQLIQPEQVTMGSKQIQVPNISSFALFYEVGAETANADDNIDMHLQGVMVSSPSRNSTAVIKVGETAERYVIGQLIEGTAYRLAAVYWDNVVLKNNTGSTKVLKFSGIANLYQPEPSQEAETQSTNNPPPIVAAPGSQNAIGQAIEQMTDDREEYLKKMGVNTGGGQGYEVTEQTPAALRNKLGLRPGDRILSLNGKSVGQGQSDVQLLEQAKREGQVKIEIKRGDQVMTFQQSL